MKIRNFKNKMNILYTCSLSEAGDNTSTDGWTDDRRKRYAKLFVSNYEEKSENELR